MYDIEEKFFVYKFEKGINYFRGGNNSGKTVFYSFMDYMFGSSKDISKEHWCKGTFFRAMMEFSYNGIEYVAVRTINKEINFFGYLGDDILEPVNSTIYKERMMSVFTTDEDALKKIRNFVEEDLTYRSFSIFNFLGETRQGVLNNFFDKCIELRYSIKLTAILNYIFNNNLDKIFKLKKELQILTDEVNEIEDKKKNFHFVCDKVNKNLSVLGIRNRYTGYNSSDIYVQLDKIKKMEEVDKSKSMNIATLETVYNNLSEQIRVYENSLEDARQFEKQSDNQKKLVDKLNALVKENQNYGYLIKPILELSNELERSISFSKYIQKDETIDFLKRQRVLVRSQIRENDSRFKCYSVEEKSKVIGLIEELLSNDTSYDESELIEKKKRIKEIKGLIKLYQNADDEKKITDLSRLITRIYFAAQNASDVVATDFNVEGFEINYFKNGNILQPTIKNDDKKINYYTGSMARHTLMQLAGYLGFMKILLEDNRYPIIPCLIIDHISKPFDKENSLAIGKIFEKAYEYIGKDNLQIFIFDDKNHNSLGIMPDHMEELVTETKTGFNPFYMPM